MDFQLTTFVELTAFLSFVILISVLSRLPFLQFQMDEDMSLHFYIARFSDRGFRWIREAFTHYPNWLMDLVGKVYSRPDGGVYRIRLLLMAAHAITALSIFSGVMLLTGNPWAALWSSAGYAFFATAPVFSAESYNSEQLYLPLLLCGLQLLWLGPAIAPYSGLCFGTVAVLKIISGFYIPVLMLVIAWQYGLTHMLFFVSLAVVPLLISNLLEWQQGYMNRENLDQIRLRLIAGLRCSQLKRMYGSITGDIGLIIKQTLPLWVTGVPALLVSFGGEQGIWISAFTIATLAMLIGQRGFSRYHYIPFTALLALTSGKSIDYLSRMEVLPGIAGFAILAIITFWSVKQLLPFYLRPMDTDILARYEKFEQFLYLPHLGKILKRLIRMRGETNKRIYVWGNFTQLYHSTGLPSSDIFIYYCIGPWDDPVMVGIFDTIIGGLIKHKPVYLIKTNPDLDMTLLEQLTGLKYKLVKVVLARYPVYRLVSSSPPQPDPLSLPCQKKLQLMATLTQGAKHTPGINKTDADTGRLSTALKECRKLIRINKYDIQGLMFLAELNDRLGLHEASAFAYIQIIKLKPSDPNLRLMLAKQYIFQNKKNEAMALIKEEIKLFANNPNIYFHLGLLYYYDKQYPQAVTNFNKALLTGPTNILDCLFFLAESLKEIGEKKRSRKLYTQLWKKAGNNSGQWYRTRAAVAMAKLDVEKRPEWKTIEYYLRNDPENEMLLYTKASAMEREDCLEKARSLFETLTTTLEKDNLRAGAWFRLARISDIEKKERMLKECLKLEPCHSGAWKLLRELENCSVKT